LVSGGVDGSSLGIVSTTPDSAGVFYARWPSEGRAVELQQVPTDGGPTAPVSPGLEYGDIRGFTWLSSWPEALFAANPRGTTPESLFLVTATGLRWLRLSSQLPDPHESGSEIGLFRTTPDESYVVYRADPQPFGTSEYHAAPIAGGPVTTLAYNDRILGWPGYEFQLSNAHLVYLNWVSDQGGMQLAAVPLPGHSWPSVVPDEPQTTGSRPSNDCTITGTAGDDVLIGTPGDDVICGLQGHDTLKGLSGNDVLLGGPGNDTLRGGRGRDQLAGNKGRDRLFGNRGSDTLKGGKGADLLRGGLGHDTLKGGSGKDNLMGNRGNDALYGGKGNDRLRGGAGNDTLNGGRGRDSAR